MNVINLALIQSYRPRNFRERGVSAPFTTPILSGARLRRVDYLPSVPSERAMIGPSRAEPSATDQMRAAAVEVIVPNPSGGRGVYILPWAEIASLCRPTMHDVVLGQMIEASDGDPNRGLTPMTIRDAARTVALQGLAGRAAARAAEQALQNKADRLIATRFTLLMDAIQQTEPAHARGQDLAQETPSEIERRGGAALARLASALHQPKDRIAEGLDMLAEHYAEIGIGFGAGEAYVSRLLASMSALRTELLAGTRQGDAEGDPIVFDGEPQDGRHALSIVSAAELGARMARVKLTESRGKIADLTALMRDALASPGEFVEQITRPIWLLDGWERICLLWQSAPEGQRRSDLLQEIVRELPVLPDEAETWLGLPAGTAQHLQQRHWIPPLPARDERVSLERIARNERLRTLAG